VGSSSLARWLLDDAGYALVFVCLAVGQAIVGAANLAQSIAAARADYPFILRISTIGAVAGALVVSAGVWSGGVIGGAIALVINAALPGLAAITLKRHAVLHIVGRVRGRVTRGDVVLLLKYASVALLGAASLSLSQIASRNLVGQSLGWESVGLWQTVVRMSDVYMQLISVLVMSYVLPRLSTYSSFSTMHAVFLRVCGALCGTFITGAIAVYALRNVVIPLLFSRAYLPAESLLLLQLLGDLFRVIAVLISVAMMARGLTRMSMVYEGAQGILTFTLTAALLEHAGPAAAVQAYCVTYAMLMLVLAYMYWTRLRESRKS
jgi:O-antigen/teichoic acid export membrane protein